MSTDDNQSNTEGLHTPVVLTTVLEVPSVSRSMAAMIDMINSRVQLEKDDYDYRVELPRKCPVAWVIIASRNPRNKALTISAEPKG